MEADQAHISTCHMRLLRQKQLHDMQLSHAGAEVGAGGAAAEEVAAARGGSQQAAAWQRQPDRECSPMTRSVAVAAARCSCRSRSSRCGQCCSRGALFARLLETREPDLHRGVSRAASRLRWQRSWRPCGVSCSGMGSCPWAVFERGWGSPCSGKASLQVSEERVECPRQ